MGLISPLIIVFCLLTLINVVSFQKKKSSKYITGKYSNGGGWWLCFLHDSSSCIIEFLCGADCNPPSQQKIIKKFTYWQQRN